MRSFRGAVEACPALAVLDGEDTAEGALVVGAEAAEVHAAILKARFLGYNNNYQWKSSV